uniref:R3H domain-containing protein n=3 Tax=Spongospora subterranea TaxID=70186 RepID=A0A0H5QW36_9EUKA|eukprot:CRZ06133.1 hypothetical protein [Spongospora subterranea]
MCAGQHVELTAVPCSAAPTSCGHQCNHPQSCLHPCSKVCHVHDSDTQCKECNAPITSMCPCGRRSQRISKSSILSELECDEQCLVQLRNQNLASALQVEPVGPNRPQAPAPVPWSTPILQLAQTYSRFVLSIEHQMANLIMSESVGGAYMDPVSGPRLFLLRHMAAQYGLFCETYTEAQRSCLRLTRQGAKSAVLPSFLQLSRVAALFAKCPSSVIPKAAASSLCETSAIPAVQFSGVAEGGAALIQRLVSSWRQTYAVASRWIDSQTVVIAFGSLAGLHAALADVDESTLVYADAATPPAAVAEEMCQSLSSAPFGTGRGRLSRQAAVSAIGRPANIWDTLPSEDTVPDTWDS